MPTLSHDQKLEYVRLHLFNELRYLLAAAAEWFVQDQLKLEKPGYEVQVYAMDSAFLHARALFEFFVGKKSGNYYTVAEFLGSGATLPSPSYSGGWEGPLHAHLMHIQDRSRPQKLSSAGTTKDLKEMPKDFANEILRLWGEFESELEKRGDQQLKELAQQKRKEAVDAANCVVRSEVAQKHAEERGQILDPVFVLS